MPKQLLRAGHNNNSNIVRFIVVISLFPHSENKWGKVDKENKETEVEGEEEDNNKMEG